MTRRMLYALSGMSGALILNAGASASYVGLSMSLFTSVTIRGQARSVWRVYANFTNPNDCLSAVIGSPTAGNIRIRQLNALGLNGSGFYNHDFGGVLPPNPALVDLFPDLKWDTYVTIGLTGLSPGRYDSAAVSPAFPTNLLSGTGGESNNAAWFTAGPVGQGRAGSYPGLRVLMAQFTVNAGEYVSGTVAISGFNNGTQGFQINGQTFSPPILLPSPGGLALLGLAGALGTRRRR